MWKPCPRCVTIFSFCEVVPGGRAITDETTQPDPTLYRRANPRRPHGALWRRVSFIVPHDIPDDAVYESGWLERFVGCDVDLGEGYVLHITISGDCHGVDARIERTKEA